MTMGSSGDYVAVQKDEDDVEAAAAPPTVTAVAVDEPKTAGVSVIPEEARGLTWEDTFYDSRDDVVAVFDIDVDLIKGRTRRVQWLFLILAVAYLLIAAVDPDEDAGVFNFLGWYFLFFFGILAYKIGKMQLGGVHVAVTREGVRKDLVKFPFGSMFNTTVMMYYAEIKSCSVRRNCSHKLCCRNPDAVVIEAECDSTKHMIVGLKDPESFAAVVNAMLQQSGQKQALNQLVNDLEFAIKAKAVEDEKKVSTEPLL